MEPEHSSITLPSFRLRGKPNWVTSRIVHVAEERPTECSQDDRFLRRNHTKAAPRQPGDHSARSKTLLDRQPQSQSPSLFHKSKNRRHNRCGSFTPGEKAAGYSGLGAYWRSSCIRKI